jgi:hypothetical protein
VIETIAITNLNLVFIQSTMANTDATRYHSQLKQVTLEIFVPYQAGE